MEGKLLIISSQLCLLTPIAELLRTLLLPIDWQCVYVPVCPDYMLRFLQAPMPFILGMSREVIAGGAVVGARGGAAWRVVHATASDLEYINLITIHIHAPHIPLQWTDFDIIIA